MDNLLEDLGDVTTSSMMPITRETKNKSMSTKNLSLNPTIGSKSGDKKSDSKPAAKSGSSSASSASSSTAAAAERITTV